ncbi:rod-binding protein [Shewanella fidelis]|uniref:Rod-binding protein n=1 Tax=Shewanella fidelis TaxID=173509 RepID=A0AAW8NS10_9GAMM|nr:rod-binding protein [Shewanella fidelis]MDR8525913.1 rod-binding protein [Shewanella fidelis]MDW4813899.1 rod-binding protein [Shewanella fidelis]MDW4817909.1 rod-binding protein [Shewanella fidelis]MDW4821976.1 rod-binding protein [Shewanella fidelis]MDW4826141.1 rod-binding protein [Shewanella fidelis]
MKIDNNHSYLNQLDAGDLIKANGEHGALKLVSQQFEAQFLQTVLKQMRSASDVMADKDSPLSSQNDGMYRDWHDAELAGRLSQMQSTGLAEVMTKQLSAGLKSESETVASNNQPHNGPTTHAMQPALILPFINKLPE